MRSFEDVTSRSLLLPETWTALDADGVLTLLWALLLDEQPDIARGTVYALAVSSGLEKIVSLVYGACNQSLPQKSEQADGEAGASDALVSWDDLWATGRVGLHLTEEGFWRTTPREFDALVQRRTEEREADDYRAGVLAATIMASVGVEAKPTDFFALESSKRAQRPQAVDDQISIVKMLNAACGGQIVEVYS
jgi:hypothetical protein